MTGVTVKKLIKAPPIPAPPSPPMTGFCGFTCDHNANLSPRVQTLVLDPAESQLLVLAPTCPHFRVYFTAPSAPIDLSMDLAIDLD